eukprot:GFUD01041875.1.p1 GENE.GFUD01041875.1~~GFUD01041875.1.p1  ORF type:complete len:248 (+),score=113.61 GFUD01041875.1:108-851(+)
MNIEEEPSPTTAEEERWAALESNPEVLTRFCHLMGVAEEWKVVDIWGLDPDLLALVPQPVVSLVLLFPTRTSDGSKARQFTTVEKHGLGDQVYFLRQLEGHLDNACGTIAMLHSLMNNRAMLGLEGEQGVVEKFYCQTKDMDGEQRGKYLDTYKDIVEVHNMLAIQGQSNMVQSEKVCHHFVCLTEVSGHLVELDGAYNSGPCVVDRIEDGDTLLSSAARFVQSKYITPSSGNIEFALMALVKGYED